MIDSLWNKNETSVILRPSIKNTYTLTYSLGPVSTAIERNMNAVESSEYFWNFLVAAISVTSPRPRAAAATYDSALVLTTVTSKKNSLTERQRI